MSFLGSIVDAGASLVNNMMNLDFQQNAIDQNMALTRESWARDDNAVQRRVADLKAAGLNPILAAGSAAGNSNPIRVEPKRSDFKTDFGSHDFNEDWQAVQRLKAQKLTNQNAALQNAILDEQKKGIALDNQKKELEISHYGETPVIKAISWALEGLFGVSANEALGLVGKALGFRPDDNSGMPSYDEFMSDKAAVSAETPQRATVSSDQARDMSKDIEDFFSGVNLYYTHSRSSSGMNFIEFTSAGKSLLKKMSDEYKVDYEALYDLLVKTIADNYDKIYNWSAH